MTIGKLETIGYTEKGAAQCIEAFLAQPETMLLDIRFVPRCRWNAQWNKSALRAKYGTKYRHLRCFGNVNYHQPGQPIQLANPAEGLYSVVNALFLRGTSFMLLCACKDYERCHRKTVYDLIMREVAQRQVIGAWLEGPWMLQEVLARHPDGMEVLQAFIQSGFCWFRDGFLHVQLLGTGPEGMYSEPVNDAFRAYEH